MPLPRRAAALLAASVLVGAVSGCTGDEGEAPAAEPTFAPTPLEEYDAAAADVARAPFCGAVPAEAVVEALAGEARREAHYGSGDRVRLTPGVRDVAHEWGCWWRGASGASARGWVFVPPVPTSQADALARSFARSPGCEEVGGAAPLGSPTAARVCERGGRLEASYAGLVGDAWVGCSVTAGGPAARVDRAALVERTGAWCVQVVTAASAAAAEEL